MFYVPHAVKEYIPEALSGHMHEDGFFNTMVLIDGNGAVGTLFGNVGGMAIFSKSKILKTNLFQLMELEGQMKKETFTMIIEEYLNTVSSYEFIYTWMADNVAKDIPEEYAKYGSYFTLQSNSIKEHLQQIKERFIDPKTEKISELNFDRIIESGKKFFPTMDPLNTTQKEDTPQKSRRKKKAVLPTEEEVDKWLLETVFSVDLSDKK